MLRAVYPGSFDPVTFGHLNIIQKAAFFSEELIVGILRNNTKSPLFTIGERVNMLTEVTKDYSNVRIEVFDGLLIDFAKSQNANCIIRGLRAITDLDYELQMSHTNHKLDPHIETIFMNTCTEYSYISSSMVKEIARYGGDVTSFVPQYVVSKLDKSDKFK